jgi:hypothetical protein
MAKDMLNQISSDSDNEVPAPKRVEIVKAEAPNGGFEADLHNELNKQNKQTTDIKNLKN